jgi:hypothetical protein
MIGQALQNLRPNAQWAVNGEDAGWQEIVNANGEPTGEFESKSIIWLDEVQTMPSKEELDAEIARLEAEFVSSEYQRLRKFEYPPLADLADAIYWQSQGDETKMTAYLAAVEAVKQKYPKGV